MVHRFTCFSPSQRSLVLTDPSELGTAKPTGTLPCACWGLPGPGTAPLGCCILVLLFVPPGLLSGTGRPWWARCLAVASSGRPTHTLLPFSELLFLFLRKQANEKSSEDGSGYTLRKMCMLQLVKAAHSFNSCDKF